MQKNEIVMYQANELTSRIDVRVEDETVWLNRNQIAALFNRDVKTIGKHVNNVFSEGELDRKVVVAKFATTMKHGAIKGKTQTQKVEYYNLDVIISVGYSDAWIEKRMRGIAVRDELTNEWGQRGVKEQVEYSILTAEISKATFGMTPSKYKEYKGLQKENLRDHMTDLELIFTMLGEASTTEIVQVKDAQGFDENKVAAKKGGEVAGSAIKDLEGKTGKKISTKENYIEVPEKVKRIKGKR
jgi:hypothetical protein